MDFLNSGGGTSLIFIIVMIAIFYFLLIRPQQKRQKEHAAMLGNLRPDDEITTAGGIYGTVLKVKDDTVIIKVDDKCKLQILKSSISQVRQQADYEEDYDDEEE